MIEFYKGAIVGLIFDASFELIRDSGRGLEEGEPGKVVVLVRKSRKCFHLIKVSNTSNVNHGAGVHPNLNWV